MKTIADNVVDQMPLQTRAHVLAEGKNDHAFWPYLTRIARQPDGAKVIDDEMKRAAINELDPSRHKDMRGKWPLLRFKVRYIKSQIAQNARPGFMGPPPPQTLRGLEGLAEGIPGMVTSLDTPSTPAASSSGTDIWGTIGRVLSSAATAAGSIYSARITTDAQRDIEKLRAQAAQGIALTQQQQQQLQAAQAAAATGGSSGLSTAMYILLGLLGLGGLVFLFSVISRRR